MKTATVSNEEIAEVLDRVADLLELEDESSFRVRSYRHAGHRVVRGRERECREHYGV